MKDLRVLEKLLSATDSQFTKLTFEATVDTGFEQIAVEECIEKFGKALAVEKSRGRIFFNRSFTNYDTIHTLRGVDHVNVIAGMVNLPFKGDKTADLELIRKSAFNSSFRWCKSMELWKECAGFDGTCYPTVKEHNLAADQANRLKSDDEHKYALINGDEDEEAEEWMKGRHFKGTSLEEALEAAASSDDEESFLSIEEIPKVPKFRVTCHRVGGNHSFTSMDAAWVFGGEIHDKLHWLIDLTNYDLEVILQIQENDIYVGISLNRMSKHHRNITHFGPTTLRATVCYNMLRLCDPQPGDIVIDPLCGGGSIPIEGGLEFPKVFFLAGDMHDKAITRTGLNLKDLPGKPLKIDPIWWDATNLPFKDNSIDIFVSDLPFGKRSGSKSNNKFLYRKLLNELARTARLTTGKGVFLTYDKNCFNMAYGMAKTFWRQTRFLCINIGGLDAGCFVLQRTGEEYFEKLSRKEKKVLAQKEWLRKKIEREAEQSQQCEFQGSLPNLSASCSSYFIIF